MVRTAADVGLAVAVGGALGGATIGKLGALITGSSFAVARGVAGSAAALVLLRAIGPR